LKRRFLPTVQFKAESRSRISPSAAAAMSSALNCWMEQFRLAMKPFALFHHGTSIPLDRTVVRSFRTSVF
jgi:hypothetical protein